ncbi:hypothetical protein FORC31_p341 (plasmid) [Escherichia coli]|nr:hypothetical protein FORC31_p341 [Escherichia coli]
MIKKWRVKKVWVRKGGLKNIALFAGGEARLQRQIKQENQAT